MTSVDIDSGTIDGTDITVGSGKTLNVSAGTLTLADGQIAGAKIADDAIDSDHYAAASVDFAHIQNVAANSLLGRNAGDAGVISEVALTNTQILIGDGSGFGGAASSGDVTMTNAGVVSIGATKVTGAMLNTDVISGTTTALTSGLATTDELLVSDNGTLSRMDLSVLYAATSSLSNKSIDLDANTLSGTVAEFNAALQSESFATLGGTETLVAKTLTSPTIGSTGWANANHAHAASNSGGQITLGTGTTGNYVATLTGTANEVEVSASTGAITIGLPDDVTIAGNLTVTGTTTQVDTVTMNAQNAVIFEGATADSNETTLTIVDPTADRTQRLINQSGWIPLLDTVTTTAIAATPAELNIMDGGTAASSTTLADADRVVVNDDGTMKQVALTDFETYFEAGLDTLNSVTSASALATVGTIGTGVWQGTAIAGGYIANDAIDSQHYTDG